MSILVNRSTRVICQGMGKAGTFHALQCREYGTAMVGGVTPGKGGTIKEGIPLFNTVAEAVEKTGANATMIFVPPAGAADAILEAADAGIKVIIAITEGIPVLDMSRVKRALKQFPGVRLVGPNCPGVITPGELPSFPARAHSPTKPFSNSAPWALASPPALALVAIRSLAPTRSIASVCFKKIPKPKPSL
jgi:succinyl-CoA synthetase alpha subunit